MKKMKKGLVSIILLNMNGIGLTRQCLESVKKNTAYKPTEIIVVDNGSDAGNVKELKELKKSGSIGTLILNKANLGYSAGVNQGFEAAGGEFLFHLDNDTLVEEGWLEKSLEALRNYPKKAGVIGSNLVAEADYGKGLHGKEIVRERLATCGAALMYTREALDKVGLLDAERFSPIYGEEQDWCYRARNAGFAVIETNASRVLHLGGRDTTKSAGARARRELLETRRLKAMAYNLTLSDFLRHFPGLGMVFLNSLREGMAGAVLKGYWNNARGIGEILRERKRRKARLF